MVVLVLGILTGIAAVVLGAAGVVKIVDPGPATQVLAALGRSGGTATGRAVGLVEASLALWLLVTGSRLAMAAVGIAYLVLAAAVVQLRRRSPSTPCGCFGSWSGPATPRHVLVNLGGAVIGFGGAATSVTVAPPGDWAPLAQTLWWGVVLIGALGVAIVLAANGSPTRHRRNHPLAGSDR